MQALPTRIGAFDLIRRLGSTDGSEAYEGRRTEGDRGRVFLLRVLPAALEGPGRRETLEQRARDLMGVRHPFLVPVLDLVETSGELLVVEQWVEALSLTAIISWCRDHQVHVPHNVFLNLSTQICNGLEALHGRPGKASGSPNVLHMALRPSSLFVSLDGRVMLGGYGLTRTPALSEGALDQILDPRRAAYLSPEQTEPDQKLIPASDIFSLASVLYELLSLESLFCAETTAVTLQRLRRAEITTQLLGVKEQMPGLDKVLYRALSSSPRHRYQRAFVLREDLRGLMAGYSFASISDDTRAFLEPILGSVAPSAGDARAPTPGPADAFEDKVATRIDPDPTSTAAFASQALAERILREQRGERPAAPAPTPIPQTFPAPRGPSPASTAAWVAQATGQPRGEPVPPAQAGPTIAPLDDLPGPVAPPTPDPVLPEIGSPGIGAAPPVDLPLQPKPTPTAVPLPLDSPAAAHPAPAGQFAASRSAALASAAPPPGRASAPPTAVPLGSPRPSEAFDARTADTAGPPFQGSPPPIQDPEEDTGDWQPPRKRGGLMFLLVFGGLVLVLVCSGGLWAGWRYLASALIGTPDDLASYEAPSIPAEPEPPAEGAGSLDGIAAVDPTAAPAEAPAEPPAPEAIAVAPPTPTPTVPEDPSAARDRPAYATPTGQATSPSRGTGSARPETASGTSSPSRQPSRTTASAASPDRSTATAPRSTGPSAPTTSTRPSATSDRGAASGSSAPRTTAAGSARGSSTSPSAAARPTYAPEPVALEGDGLTDASSGASGTASDSHALLDRYASAANAGGLGSSDIMVVEMVQPEDQAFTRSRLLLVMNAKAKGDATATKRYLDELSLRPENQYNPVVLAEYARYYVNKQDYQRALDKAVLAERHWARLPPELVFLKKAEIYEVQAAAYQGLFYRSEDNLELLDKSIRQWKKYSEHVMTESRTDLQARATREIEKLENIRERLQ